jgi:alkyldihydroxyacetonephosphate synthase
MVSLDKSVFPPRKWNGWGDPAEHARMPLDSIAWNYLCEQLALKETKNTTVPPLEQWSVPASRLPEKTRTELQKLVGAAYVNEEAKDRLLHGLGKSYRDLVRLRLQRLPALPDAVVYPASTKEVLDVVQMAAAENLQVIPFGGGSSVVGGVEVRPRHDGDLAVVLDTCRLNAVVEVDEYSGLARLQAGMYGPELEKALNAKGFTLGHFPQSFEYSALGGWIATRGAGQQSTKYGKIEDMVRGLTMATPAGLLETRVYPGHAAGPDLNQVLVGSEGVYGVITEAVMKIRRAPEIQRLVAYAFPGFRPAREALRELMQRGITPAVLRVSNRTETASFLKLGTVDASPLKLLLQDIGVNVVGLIGPSLRDGCLMLIGFEGDRAVVQKDQALASRVLKAHKGFSLGESPGRKWLHERYRMPYLRDLLLDRGLLVDTLETATTWNNLYHLYSETREALREGVAATGAKPLVLCHISHVYPDGASLYFTFMARREGDGEEQWIGIKQRASNTIAAAGGVLSHHHAVGYEHKPWMEHEHGAGLEVFRAVKTHLDPSGVMNPGKLW